MKYVTGSAKTLHFHTKIDISILLHNTCVLIASKHIHSTYRMSHFIIHVRTYVATGFTLKFEALKYVY